jgi:hypothetical protein
MYPCTISYGTLEETVVIKSLSKEWLLLIILLLNTATYGKVLFLAHWNEGLKADIAAGRAEPVIQYGAKDPPLIKGGGYPFKNSMPSINGLFIGSDTSLAYATAGNMTAAEGTLDFWLYPRTDFVATSATAPHLFSVNLGSGSTHSWKNTLILTYGGLFPNLSFVVVDNQGKWVGAVGYLADKWMANSRWHRIAVSWSTKQKRLSLFVDGRLESRAQNVKLLSSLLPCFYIGSNRGWQGQAQHNYDEFRILNREINEVEAAADYCRDFEFTKDDTFRPETLMEPIDLSKVATTPFEDEEADDQKGGWTDQGAKNDFRNIPRGDLKIFNIPFRVGKNCVVLANHRKQYYPQQAQIDINKPYGGFLFIHTSAWASLPDRIPAHYLVNYTDGSQETIPLKTSENIADWWAISDKDLVKARFVLAAKGGMGGVAGAFMFFWKNPHPEKPIKNIIFKTTNNEAMPILIALTGVQPAPKEVYNALELLTYRKTDVEGQFREIVTKYRSKLLEVNKIQSILAQTKPTQKQLSSFYGREVRRYMEDARTYLREVEKLNPEIEKAITQKDVTAQWVIEKSLSYIQYAGETVQGIPELLEKADKAVLMTPLEPKPMTFPAGSDALLNSHPRTEILLNGIWETNDSKDRDRCGNSWKPVVIPDHSLAECWVRKVVTIPAAWKNKKIEIFSECSVGMTEIYINRRFAARRACLEPITVDITDKVAWGAVNEILLFNNDSGTKHAGFNYLEHSCGVIRQDIYLKVSPKTRITEPFARIDDKNNFILTGRLEGCEGKRGLTVEIKLASEKQSRDFGRFKITPDERGNFTLAVPWKNPILWGIGGEYGRPQLCFVDLKLFDDQALLDQSAFRTGFRKFGIYNKLWFALNNKKIILQGDHLFVGGGDAGWKDTATSRAFLTRYYRYAREANFNLVRYHVIDGGNTFPSGLEVADELGYLVEPESMFCGCPARLADGTQNFDDPVFREKSENYFRGFARKLRIHPSVVLFSLSNEVFLGGGRHIPDAVKFFLAMEKVVAQEMPGVIPIEQGNAARPEFAVTDVHYWQDGSGSTFKDWKKKGDRPISHGEWAFYENMVFDMNHPDPKRAKAAMIRSARAFEEQIKGEIAEGVACTMPFTAFNYWNFCSADVKLMGPWGDLLVDKSRTLDRWFVPYTTTTRVKVLWPALSGKGNKIDTAMVGTFADNINFFDPTRKEVTLNELYFAFKRAFTPMPPLRPVISPEVIATVDPKQDGLPVFAACEGSPLFMGVLPDTDGKAWFELPAPGNYEFSRIDQAGIKTIKFTAMEKPLLQPPGFGYIDRIDLK